MFIIYNEEQYKKTGNKEAPPKKYPAILIDFAEDSAPYAIYVYEEDISIMQEFINLFKNNGK